MSGELDLVIQDAVLEIVPGAYVSVGSDIPAGRLLPTPIGDDGQVATVVDGAPAWADPADSGAPLSDAAPEPLGETAAAGAAEEAARADHVHELPTPSDIGVWDSETGLIGENHMPASMTRDTEAQGWIDDAVTDHAAATDPHGDRSYADSLFAANDAMVFKGALDCSANPNYPAADAGHTYRVSVAGRIGGGSGPRVELGELVICTVDGTTSGTHAAVGASWTIGQTNLDGAVIGPAGATDGGVVVMDGTSGRLVKVGNAADVRSTLGLVIGTNVQAHDADLDAIAALATTAYGRAFLALADQAALFGLLGTGTPSAATALRGDGVWARPASGSMFGSGADGSVTISADTSVTSDLTAGFKHYENLTIDAGKVLSGSGIIYVRDTLTIGAGAAISANGANAVGLGGGAGGGGPATGTVTANGGNGSSGAGGGGNPQTNPTTGSIVALGGNGGAGGAGGSGIAGPAGVAPSLTTTTEAGLRTAVAWLLTGTLPTRNGSTLVLCGAGRGGGGGGGDGASQGGGGGGGGGFLLVIARRVAGTGTIRANGGNGASPNPATGNRGGGGGGGGGFVGLITGDATHSLTLQANAGTGAAGSGTGGNGANGGAGYTLDIRGTA